MANEKFQSFWFGGDAVGQLQPLEGEIRMPSHGQITCHFDRRVDSGLGIEECSAVLDGFVVVATPSKHVEEGHGTGEGCARGWLRKRSRDEVENHLEMFGRGGDRRDPPQPLGRFVAQVVEHDPSSVLVATGGTGESAPPRGGLVAGDLWSRLSVGPGRVLGIQCPDLDRGSRRVITGARRCRT